VAAEGVKSRPAQGEPADVSVVICAYTEARWADLCAAVESVKLQTVPPREIIVVIDHNAALFKRAQAAMPDVLVLENREAHGASGSRNSGVAAAHGSVIAFLDDDAEAAVDWLNRLLASYSSADVLGAGGTLEPVWLGVRPRWFPEEFNWVVGCTYRGLPEKTAPVRNLIAANMSVRRDVFDISGGFRSGYGNVKSGTSSRPVWLRSTAGDEETEFCIQALKRYPKGVWLYEPQAQVRHKVPAARGRWDYFLRRCYDEGFGKALLSQFVGAQHGLASERAYTLRTLPQGVVKNLDDALFRRDWAGLARAGAIVIGLAVTMAGYAIGGISSRFSRYHVL
jgi:glycosyltransferase involved in cell wall biosynthesis